MIRRQALLRLGVSGLVLALAIPKSLGQELEDTTLLDTIIVTGERFERSLFDTYTGISVLDQEELERSSINAHITDVVTRTPNVFVEGLSEVPSIRGVQGGGAGGLVSSTLTSSLPRLSYIVDGVTRATSLPNSNGMSLWDTRQVEVLRGPQSLLRGRSALAGAIVVETNDPSFEPEAALQAAIALDEYHGAEYILNGLASGPLTQNIAARITFELADGEDPRRAIDVPDDWIVEYDNMRFRGKLLGEFDTTLGGLTVNLLGEHQQGTTPQTRNLVQTQAVTGMPISERVWIDALAGPFGIPARTFDTMANTASIDVALDTEYGTFGTVISYIDDSYESIPEQVYPFPFDVEEHSFTQDFSYEFGDSERVQARQASGILGISLEQREQKTDLGGALLFRSDSTTDSQAVFADLRYGVTDQITLFGGARIQHYDGEYDQFSSVATPFGTIAGTQLHNIDETVFLPALGLAYYFNDETVLSGSVRRGYNPGGSSVNIFTGQPFVYESEYVTTGEVTFRQALQQFGVQYSVTAFYNDFENPQLYAELVPGNRASLQVVNQDRGISYGLELEGSWQMFERLRIDGSVGLLHTEISEAAAFNPELEGNSFGQDPSLTASIGAAFQVNEYLSLDGRATYRGSSYNDFNEVPNEQVGDYWIVDVGATAEYRNFEARASIANLFNETGVTRYLAGGTSASVTEPLTFGLSVTARW